MKRVAFLSLGFALASAVVATALQAQSKACPVAGRYFVVGRLPGAIGSYRGEAVISGKGTGCHVKWFPPNDSQGSGTYDNGVLTIYFTFKQGGSGVVRYMQSSPGVLDGVWWMNATPASQGTEKLSLKGGAPAVVSRPAAPVIALPSTVSSTAQQRQPASTPALPARPVEDAKAAARAEKAATIATHRAAAEQGDANAMYMLGRAYQAGDGIEEDDVQALRWFRAAAGKGHGKANFEVGQAYDFGRGVAKDRAEAEKWYRAAAAAGVEEDEMSLMRTVAAKIDADQAFQFPIVADESAPGTATYNRGARAMRAIGTPTNHGEAVRLFDQAMELGNAHAIAALAQVYQDGYYKPRNETESVRLYTIAADKGVPAAMLALAGIYETGRTLEKDLTTAARWYRAAADKGVVEAMARLGWMYEQGKGVAPNQVEATKWLRRAAEGGHEMAQLATGDAYHDGLGVKRDFAEAAKWYRRAADGGDYGAMLKLGAMYFDGRGVPKDVKQAIRWLRKPPRHYETMDYLGTIYALGLGVPRDGEEAVRAYKASDTREAHYNLGVLYYNGLAVPKNDAEAQAWFKKAADGGHKIAKARLQGGEAAAAIPLDSAVMYDVAANSIYDPVCTRWASPVTGLRPFNAGANVKLELVSSGQEGASYVTRFKTVAMDPDGDKVSYRYFTNVGTITGDGAEATLRADKAGAFVVRVEADDGKGCVSEAKYVVEDVEKVNQAIEIAKFPDPPEWKRRGVLCSRDPRFTIVKDGTARFNMPPVVKIEAVPKVAADGSVRIELHTTATDADGDALLYTYSTTSGTITGDGPNVVWVPSPEHLGSAAVEVYDRRGCTTFASYSRM